MDDMIHVCAGANERFMIGATAAFAGIAKNAKPETGLHFHIFNLYNVVGGHLHSSSTRKCAQNLHLT